MWAVSFFWRFKMLKDLFDVAVCLAICTVITGAVAEIIVHFF